MNTCIKCNNKRVGTQYSHEVAINKNLGVKTIHSAYSQTYWNWERKYSISGYICDKCIEPLIKFNKQNDLWSGVIFLIFFFILIIASFYVKSGDTGGLMVLLLISIASGIGSFFGFNSYFRKSHQIRAQKIASRIILDNKSNIEKFRKEKKLCEICGDKEILKISIHQKTNFAPSVNLMPSMVFYRCQSHKPTEGEFMPLRVRNFEVFIE